MSEYVNMLTKKLFNVNEFWTANFFGRPIFFGRPNFFGRPKFFWTSKFFLDVQISVFGRPIFFWTSKFFWASKIIWTSKKNLAGQILKFGRPKKNWESRWHRHLCLSGTLPEPQPVGELVRIQDSDFIPQAQTTSYGHDLRSNSFRQIYCVVVEQLKLLIFEFQHQKRLLLVIAHRPMILGYVYKWVSRIIWPFISIFRLLVKILGNGQK